jgi:hypothetical protein
MHWVIFGLLLWAAIGSEIFRQEAMINKRLLVGRSPRQQLKIFWLCAWYGPYARKKVLSEL